MSKIILPALKFRHCPDPHKRGSVVQNKKIYTRKDKHRKDDSS